MRLTPIKSHFAQPSQTLCEIGANTFAARAFLKKQQTVTLTNFLFTKVAHSDMLHRPVL
jgi:hypothetical protein